MRVWSLAGKELAALALEEVDDVRALKEELQQQYGFSRFRQVLLQGTEALSDCCKLQRPVDLQLVLRDFEASSLEEQLNDIPCKA